MKYHRFVPENFLLLRFVVTRQCNYRCPYCYVSEEKKSWEKSMFSHRLPEEWVQAIDRSFGDRYLELYFTGGEPTLVDGFFRLLGGMVSREYVQGVRVDSNLSRLAPFLERAQSNKVKFLASFHPHHVSLETFLGKVERLRDLSMMGMANVVASRENVALLGLSPHELAEHFDTRGIFLNVAKDFHRGLRFGYDEVYREYIDALQHPLDNDYMNLKGLNTGRPCGPGKHYVSLSRHGNVYSCGGAFHGNLFEGTMRLPERLVPCTQGNCPSIVSYSFSSSNEFSPVRHLEDYVQRNREHRAGLDPDQLARLWKEIVANDRMPKEAGPPPADGRNHVRRYRDAIRRAFGRR